MICNIHADRLSIDGREVPFVPTPNQGGRMEPTLVVVHDTAGPSAAGAIEWFKKSSSKVSAHFVVAADGAVTQMAECDRVTWHAGKSAWHGRSGCNAFAIGIEIANPGLLTRSGDRCYPWYGGASFPVAECLEIESAPHGGRGWWLPYTPAQIAAVDGILRALKGAYPSITDVAAHFEISPKRKIDVGPQFPLARMKAIFADRDAPDVATVADLQRRLVALGYFVGGVDGTIGPRTRSATRDFQEQNGLSVTGAFDATTIATLLLPDAKPMTVAAPRTADELADAGSKTIVAADAGKTLTTVLTAAVVGKEVASVLDPVAAVGDVLTKGEAGKALAERLAALMT